MAKRFKKKIFYIFHSFRIIAMLNYCHFKYLSSVIDPVPSSLYPKGEEIGRQSWPYLRVQPKANIFFLCWHPNFYCTRVCLKASATEIRTFYQSLQPITGKDVLMMAELCRDWFDIRIWLEFLLHGLSGRMSKVLSYVKRSSRLTSTHDLSFGQRKMAPKQTLCVKYVFQTSELSALFLGSKIL